MPSVPGECPEPERQHDSELPVYLALEPDPVPQEAQVPLATIAATLSWLDEAPPTSRPEVTDSGPGVQRSTMELVQAGVRIREKAVTLEIGGRRVFGIVCEPVTVTRASAQAVFLGAAALRATR